ncbi:MAG: PTS system, nitrogen regulatory IIA component [Alphaproteobacteria bacterium]|nr:MAG: PTS system nitrogen regulatory IIA component [Caulobacteraceae bacterium]TPW06217.1 MAG: PTS system, nitrogen regulatory IIA component [Alphaproteobacteria bacterium]
MNIEEFLSPTDVLVDIRASDRARLIHDLASRAAAAQGLDAASITQELMKREALGSTGMGSGIAVPHARLNEVRRPFGLLARLKRPIDFDAIDGCAVDLVFLLLLPLAQSENLNALAAVARKLREPDRLDRMRRAADAASLFRELTA